jgi:hypothetical protein
MKTRNTISVKYITDYITSNYGEMRHNATRLAKAIRYTAKAYELDKKALFHYIIERSNGITGATSYGFDTAYGRDIRGTFAHNYKNL